ncbi:DUF7119 family protein [Halalkalicoccus jeotgali]|uniref:DUF7119 domain-containing protein n=1 Tax=Halalkalicoccus jeotgali (strain DSM 18796 / CECT 7217 / JCM 14584 / KCTC 4019 / B3) TaxID=795797 RepID=D8J3R3_HALJB|nr:hypothetical protein [Halalkalicoccus jeotgali]ADJ13404.1 hypothetical protein HacjB3_00055 [Halalkalicoccus jeotgali B3]ELY32764.1 hypothetical protein C497_19284 [Halalkalicoccus jeotgali B3]
MTTERPDGPPSDRESPVGQPVVRGDAAVTGEHAREAVQFDPDDPESLAAAAETVRRFSENTAGDEDNIYMLRGAAACAALVRGEGSYKAATERAGGDTSVAFIRKWARVHDLPQAVRRHVAMGHIAPTAAKHIARVAGDARFQLAWATVDNDLTVREVRAIASAINDGATPEAALGAHGVTAGELTVRLPIESYRELRREAAFEGVAPGEIVDRALSEYFE